MIVSDVKRYVAERGEASSTDLSLHFGIAPDALSGILRLLEAKGYIRALPSNMPSCGSSCGKCHASSCDSQRWVSVT